MILLQVLLSCSYTSNRGSNSAGKSGAGLGLYISKYLMSKMSGDMECRNMDGGGFAVILRLLIA
ncbi:hypothetical protein ACFQ3W_00810 [Paenibacillus puldeungensis]|uniref:Histidine kinase/HSP90-like ATPase domain-containing protein n=1 Tax=Paenibacillus puldeungensis TaxID=696536 RepID=A0ABW3RQX8_9BACL